MTVTRVALSRVIQQLSLPRPVVRVRNFVSVAVTVTTFIYTILCIFPNLRYSNYRQFRLSRTNSTPSPATEDSTF